MWLPKIKSPKNGEKKGVNLCEKGVTFSSNRAHCPNITPLTAGNSIKLIIFF